MALALKRAFPGIQICGVDRPDVLERAKHLRIIDDTELQRSDLVVLATPVGDILRLLDQFAIGHALVTDVGSTKVAICHKAEHIKVPFIGGHPMAGIEQSGPESATADLFKGAPYFLCPTRTTPADATERMQNIVTAIGAKPHVLPAQIHDRLVAEVSHLPQIISNLLAAQTAEHKDVAGPGLRSMTRLAASPFHVWRDIFKTSGFLPHELQSFIERLQRVLDSLEAGKFDELETLFKNGDSE